ncbi:MAG: hypothetical protein H7Z42_10370, partial [Roseiflexaceae bacterium]|nr:hypothetical protein [Roseiflexaceae bacterium]
ESGSITDEKTLATLFTADVAYNGGGRFVALGDQRGLADPALPMVPASAIRAPTDSIAEGPFGTRLPTIRPPGTDRALIIASNPYEDATTVYLGPGRTLQLNQSSRRIENATFLNPAFERINQSEQRVTVLRAEPGQRFSTLTQQDYTGVIAPAEGQPAQVSTVQMQSVGFSRADMLALADSLEPFDIQSYRSQAELFRTPQPHDPAAQAALLAALEQRPLDEGQASSFVEQHFSRQGPLPEPTIDTYHRPMYSEGGESSQTQIWSRNNGGRLEIATQRTNDRGEVVQQMLSTADQNYWYSRRYGATYVQAVDQNAISAPIVEPTWSVINLLGCGGTTLETLADGTRIVTQVDQDWFFESCNRPDYASMVFRQQQYINGTATRQLPPRVDRNFNLEVDDGPYLLGVAEQPISHRIFIDASGRAFRYEARAGLEDDGLLIEAYELSAEQRMPLAEADDAIWRSPPPQALSTLNSFAADPPFIGISTTEISFTQAISIVTTPLWHLPPSENEELRGIYGTEQPIPWGVSGEPFDTAVSRGLAVQLVYSPPISDSVRLAQTLYVGEAEKLGAFLRLDRHWRNAEPVALRVDGRSVSGWQVSQRDDERWTLFELDGSLVAVDSSTPEREARIARLLPWAGVLPPPPPGG